tara:strand:- start:431 stop:658 length:228 start_codon:yes stop_codon:yes gene_type:complete
MKNEAVVELLEIENLCLNLANGRRKLAREYLDLGDITSARVSAAEHLAAANTFELVAMFTSRRIALLRRMHETAQ